MVNVTKKNFIEQSNDLLKHLPDAVFVAIDEEMTGIRSGRLSKDDTPAERYQHLKDVPERYSIMQVGICLFIKNPSFHEHNVASEYLVRRYNFNLFPPESDEITREVTMNPSSIAFLNEHGMDFNLWTRQGISYVTEKQAETLSEKYKTERRKSEAASTNNGTIRDPTRRRITLTKQEDVNFHARAMASLREWIDGSIRGQPSLLLPACNRFLRRALYESIELEYPALILENGGPSHSNQIRVWRLSEEEKVVRKVRLQKEAWEKLVLNVGFYKVFCALSNANQGYTQTNNVILANSVEDVDIAATPSLEPLGRKIPIIVHNGLMDLLFLLTHFYSHQLPETYLEAKACIHETFPLVYDTKILATECSSQAVIGDTTILGTLYNKFVENDDDFVVDRHFQVVNSSVTDPDQLHQASYDAYMTGALFVALARRITRPDIRRLGGLPNPPRLADMLSINGDVAKRRLGRNRLYLMLTLYTIDLENATDDPLRHGLSPSSTFRVSGIDPGITNGDIIRCLQNLVEPNEHHAAQRQVRFEIVWVDNTTFMVATRTPEEALQNVNIDEAETLQRHGRLIYNALKRRFAVQEIVTLEDYLLVEAKKKQEAEAKAKKEQEKDESSGWWSSLWGLLGYDTKKRKSGEWDGNEEEPRAKRRRVS